MDDHKEKDTALYERILSSKHVDILFGTLFNEYGGDHLPFLQALHMIHEKYGDAEFFGIVKKQRRIRFIDSNRGDYVQGIVNKQFYEENCACKISLTKHITVRKPVGLSWVQ